MPALVVMAAGAASRYGGFKQLEGVGPNGEVLLEYAVFDALRAGFHRVVLIIRRELTEAFNRLAMPVEVSSVFQQEDSNRSKPWGTVHAVLSARAAVDNAPFAVINADDFYGAAAYRLAMSACGSNAVIGMPLAKTLSKHGGVTRAICEVDDQGFLTRLEEVHGIQAARDEIVSMNFWMFTPAIFDALQQRFARFVREHGSDPEAELPLPVAIRDLVQTAGLRVRVIEAPGPWFGLTHPEDREDVIVALRTLHDRGEYPTPLFGARRL